MSITPQATIAGTIAGARSYLSMVMQDLTDDQFNWLPPGTANTISAIYFHIASAEDFYIQRVIGGGALLFAGEGWVEKTGVTQVPGPRGGWDQFKEKRFSIAAITGYAQAVQARTEAYVAGLTDTELAREVSYMGKPQPVAIVLGALPVHTAFHTGEIAVLKGAQGAKGLPF